MKYLLIQVFPPADSLLTEQVYYYDLLVDVFELFDCLVNYITICCQCHSFVAPVAVNPGIDNFHLNAVFAASVPVYCSIFSV